MSTEAVSPRFAALDTWPVADVTTALVESQLGAAALVRAAQPCLAAAADAAAARLGDGAGRIVYCGAGASGRLAVQDGVELHPTYNWPHDRLVYLMAGGEPALVRSVEGAEDATGVAEEIDAMDLGPADVLIAVAASGRTPYAVAAADAARARGALTIGVMNNEGAPLAAACDHAIELPTGGEVVAGSTRMAAGTAQKIALNVLSTAVMVRLGRTYGNLMSDLASSNIKLEKRRLSILRSIVDAPEDAARAALTRAGGDIKTAALVLRGLDPAEASTRLEAARGRLRTALETLDRERA
ncbi:N-acetylmuramic acid 6-phosphate etherase [Mesobaculum littorinae]|uniref:N-acetylmuramic acid 6-phosphate etherase n=1 Tax=Mesobaculum littorinae TaxID=2486419 RepID=A0A438AFA4_9RHOB|nr:N-acetylmuramic acid 6-phosphate etherase [Mesobaculum littorinae]RVV97352.1 N-acetylmuramic acid 6-phosphate etherase [Mesobaculum littorinae]